MKDVVRELGLNVRYFQMGRLRDSEYYRNAPVRLSLDNPEYAVPFSILVRCDGKGGFKAFTRDDQEIYGGKSGDMFAVGEEPVTIEILNPEFNGELVIDAGSYTASVSYFLNNLRIDIDNERAGTLLIFASDPVPARALDLSRILIEVYNRKGIEQKQYIFNNTASFINERLNKINIELDSAETNVARFQQANQMLSISDNVGSVLQQKESSNEAVNALQRQANILQSIRKVLSDKGDGRYRLLPVMGQSADPLLASVISQYNELIMKRNRLLGNASEDSPTVLRISSQIDNLRPNVQLSLEEVEALVSSQLRDARHNSNVARARISQAPSQQKEFRAMSRQQELKEKLFIFLLQKREEAEITKQTYQPSVTFLTHPRSYGANNVNQARTLGLAFLLGVFIPLLLTYISELFDTKVRMIEDIRKVTSVSVLGGIPHMKPDHTNIFTDDFDIQESRNMIREKLQYMTSPVEGRGSVVMVTSTIPGEGKSMVTAHVSASLAQTGKRVIVLGADLRNPSLCHFYKEKNHTGLSAFLSGIESDMEPLIRTVYLTQDAGGAALLRTFFGGKVPPNPAQLLGSPRFGELLEMLRTQYDYIVIDTPPVGLVSDGFSIAKTADACVYVVRANKLDKQALKLIDEFEREKRISNIGIVLNDISRGGGLYG